MPVITAPADFLVDSRLLPLALALVVGNSGPVHSVAFAMSMANGLVLGAQLNGVSGVGTGTITLSLERLS